MCVHFFMFKFKIITKSLFGDFKCLESRKVIIGLLLKMLKNEKDPLLLEGHKS